MAAQRIPRSILALLAVLLLTAGCTPATPSSAPTSTAAAAATTGPATPAPTPTASPAPAFPLTITDDEGTTVTITAAPQRIVSLTPATTETLFEIGAGARVVGKVEDSANNFEGFPPEAKNVPIVAKFSGVDVEKIVALTPDLVVSGGAGLTQGNAVTQLRAAGITVVVAYPTTIAEGIAGIKLLGRAVGLTDAATELADGIQARIGQLKAAAATAKSKPRVFYEIDVTGGIFTPPAESIYGEMFTLANAAQIGGDASYSISLEELVAADPEVILLGDAAYGATADAVKARAGWGGMTAVKNGAIIAVDDIVITRPGPRIAEGLLALILAIHPDVECTALQLPCPTPAPSPAAS